MLGMVRAETGHQGRKEGARSRLGESGLLVEGRGIGDMEASAPPAKQFFSGWQLCPD